MLEWSIERNNGLMATTIPVCTLAELRELARDNDAHEDDMELIAGDGVIIISWGAS